MSETPSKPFLSQRLEEVTSLVHQLNELHDKYAELSKALETAEGGAMPSGTEVRVLVAGCIVNLDSTPELQAAVAAKLPETLTEIGTDIVTTWQSLLGLAAQAVEHNKQAVAQQPPPPAAQPPAAPPAPPVAAQPPAA